MTKEERKEVFDKIIDKIKAEIHASAVMKSDYEWYVNEKRIMQIIDGYRKEM